MLQEQFLMTSTKGADPWEEFLTRIEKSDPPIRALGITDYYSVAVYEQIIAKWHAGRLSGVGLIFPNVEMRLGIETAKSSAINFHLLFSPEDADHVDRIKRFLSELHFSFQGESYRCERSDLIRLGKAYDKSVTDDRKALEIGSVQFKVTSTSCARLGMKASGSGITRSSLWQEAIETGRPVWAPTPPSRHCADDPMGSESWPVPY
jgi:hypothetical protein